MFEILHNIFLYSSFEIKCIFIPYIILSAKDWISSQSCKSTSSDNITFRIRALNFLTTRQKVSKATIQTHVQ